MRVVVGQDEVLERSLSNAAPNRISQVTRLEFDSASQRSTPSRTRRAFSGERGLMGNANFYKN
jgi:hypothetical protein